MCVCVCVYQPISKRCVVDQTHLFVGELGEFVGEFSCVVDQTHLSVVCGVSVCIVLLQVCGYRV